jgi:hypothetical protein
MSGKLERRMELYKIIVILVSNVKKSQARMMSRFAALSTNL